MSDSANQALILGAQPLNGPMPTIDPFIFCVYHQDAYPHGNGKLGLDPSSLQGRDLGMDFSGRNGWSMYHGDSVPGFPAHPHRGFETVTIVRKGLVDHSDSLGATARYGEGDVQWLTTGRGVQHAEMFPMVHQDRGNTIDLFQIWLNLPAKSKMAPADFTMFWADDIPRLRQADAQGRLSEVEVIAGDYAPMGPAGDDGPRRIAPLAPPSSSWAGEPGSDVAIWIIRLEPHASLTLPPAAGAQTRRSLSFFSGKSLSIGAHRFDQRVVTEVRADLPVPLRNESAEAAQVLLLQGKPIGESVAARGPFVMNSQQELAQAIQDYQRTRFGGWQWPSLAHTHGDSARFARRPDGQVERPDAAERRTLP
ncbi:pirin family protein [Achromobacter anxifer]